MPSADRNATKAASGASAAKTLGSFVALAVFLLLPIFTWLVAQHHSFPLIAEFARRLQAHGESRTGYLAALITAALFLHYFRAFAGFSFAEHDQEFLTRLDQLPEPKRKWKMIT